MTTDVRALSAEECRSRLAEQAVGRVSVTRGALPVIVPVNYAFDGNSIVFRTRGDARLAAACDESVIAFEIDELAADGTGGWSVLVLGVASLLDESEHLLSLRLLPARPTGTDHDQFVRLRMGVVTGRDLLDSSRAAATA